MEEDANEYFAPEHEKAYEPAMHEVFEMPMMGAGFSSFNEDATTLWQCAGCAYPVYLDELPADFECPICGAKARDFKRVTL